MNQALSNVSGVLFAHDVICYPESIPGRTAGHYSETRSMQIDPYASCPCGSGKKFKRCCLENSYPTPGEAA